MDIKNILWNFHKMSIYSMEFYMEQKYVQLL